MNRQVIEIMKTKNALLSISLLVTCLSTAACGGGGGGAATETEGGAANDTEDGENITISAPSGLTALAGQEQVTLNWNAVPEADSYNIYRSTTAGAASTGELIDSVGNPSFIDEELSAGVAYYYVVRSVAAEGAEEIESSASNEVSATPSASAPNSDDEGDDTGGSGNTDDETGDDASSEIMPPSGLRAVPGDTQVSLNWAAVAEALEYCIYVSDEPGIHPDTSASYSVDLSTCVPSASDEHTVQGLANGTEYFFVVTSKDNDSESEGGNEVSATPIALVVDEKPLNDTGIDFCQDETRTDLACPVTGFMGQDGDHGRDAEARSGTLVKRGGGEAGFDFTKIDSSGEALEEDANQWQCVLDNHTGLMWEVKTRDGGLRDRDRVYTWYNLDSSENGGDPGTEQSRFCNEGPCNTSSYAEAVNQRTLCGASDWRVPKRAELINLTYLGYSDVRPSIDEQYFPNAPEFSELYWTASPSTHSGVGNTAWNVNFLGGGSSEGGKHNSYHIRLVRDARP